jgi:sporulation protein YlmC with PRC-barrel domain
MKARLISALAVALLSAVPLYAQTEKPQDFVTVQPVGQWLASQFMGQAVTNQAGETIGDINDVLFDRSGRIANVVIGVGGFLGIGEKNVAIPYSMLSMTADASGKRVVTVPLSKERLRAAPDFKPTEKTVYVRAREQAGELGQKALEKARELSKKAGEKVEDMKK